MCFISLVGIESGQNALCIGHVHFLLPDAESFLLHLKCMIPIMSRLTYHFFHQIYLFHNNHFCVLYLIQNYMESSWICFNHPFILSTFIWAYYKKGPELRVGYRRQWQSMLLGSWHPGKIKRKITRAYSSI